MFELSNCAGDRVRSLLKHCGEAVQLNEFCKICKPDVVDLGDHCRICDFVFIWGGTGVKLGKYVDVQPQVVIWGGGETIIGDYVSIGVGTALLTGSYSYKEGLHMVDGLPVGNTQAHYGKLTIQNDVYIGAHCTLLPDIIVGTGAIIGANSLVNKTVDPWGIYVGSPAKKIGARSRLTV